MLDQACQERCERTIKDLKRQLPGYRKQSSSSAARLETLFKKYGRPVENKLRYNLESLRRVEDRMHGMLADAPAKDVRKVLESLVSFYFAQCLIRQTRAKWDIHDVRTNTCGPYIVLFAGKKKYGVDTLVNQIYARGVGPRPKRTLSKILAKGMAE